MLMSNSARVEVEWKWLLLPDPADYHLPKASANALPMPASRKAQQAINAKRLVDDSPKAGDIFVEGNAPSKDYVWSEYHTCDGAECKNAAQAKVDFSKENQVWHYLGQYSTEGKAKYTEDPSKPQHNPKSSFLDSIPKPPPPPKPQRIPSYGAAHPSQATSSTVVKTERPYVYKPKKPVDASLLTPFAPQKFALSTPGSSGIPPLSFGTDPRFSNSSAFTASRLTPGSNNSQPQQQFQSGVNPQFAHASQASLNNTNQSINPAWLANQSQQMPSPSAYQSAQSTPGQATKPTTATTGSQLSIAANIQPSMYDTSSQQDTATSIVPQAPANAVPQHAWQKFSFFQAYHNR